MIDLEVGKARRFTESCGIAKIEDIDGKEYYVIFGKLWPEIEEDHEGGILGKGDSPFEAMQDAIVRLLNFRRNALNLDEVIERMKKVFEYGKGGGNYDGVFPVAIDDQCKTDNASIWYDKKEDKYGIGVF